MSTLNTGMRIVINTTPGQLTITNRNIKFEMTNEMPEMKVSTQKPQMSPDWDAYNSQVGKKSPAQLAVEQSRKSSQAAKDATSKYAQEGDQMAAVSASAAEMIAAIAKAAREQKNEVQVNSGSTPKDILELSWNKGSITIDWDTPKLEINWDGDFRPEMEYSRATVEVTVEEYEKKRFALREDFPGLVHLDEDV